MLVRDDHLLSNRNTVLVDFRAGEWLKYQSVRKLRILMQLKMQILGRLDRRNSGEGGKGWR